LKWLDPSQQKYMKVTFECPPQQCAEKTEPAAVRLGETREGSGSAEEDLVFGLLKELYKFGVKVGLMWC